MISGSGNERYADDATQRKVNAGLLLKRLFLFFFWLSSFLLPTSATYALEYDTCQFTPEELSTPDEALRNVLDGVKFCPGIKSGEGLEPFDGIVHPLSAMRRVYAAKSSIGVGLLATYADFEILSNEKGEDVEGMEHKIYRVELLYVLIDGVGRDVKGATRDGYLPICERDVVKVHLIHTPFGWYPYIPTFYGSSLNEDIRNIQKLASPIAQHTVKRYREIAAACLNHQKSSRK